MKELFLEISMNAGWLGSLGRTGGGEYMKGGGMVGGYTFNKNAP